MQPITDFNEVTMHSLEIIYTHLFNTKGPLPGKATISGGAGLASQSMQVREEGVSPEWTATVSPRRVLYSGRNLR